ncbi:MAG: hypothetical protein O3A21_09670 [Proteobacteria bacterium]|nr:hypothetical protein [Pseudomonadota bacterium]
MNVRTFFLAAATHLCLLAVLALSSAVAQDELRGPTGRYQLFDAHLTTETGMIRVPMVFDTQFGRAWRLEKMGDRYLWVRIVFKRLTEALPPELTPRAPILLKLPPLKP